MELPRKVAIFRPGQTRFVGSRDDWVRPTAGRASGFVIFSWKPELSVTHPASRIEKKAQRFQALLTPNSFALLSHVLSRQFHLGLPRHTLLAIAPVLYNL